MRIALGLSALVLSFVGAGCANETESVEDGPSGRNDELVECSEVWVDGEPIEADYQGCLLDGEPVLPNREVCENEDQLVTFEDEYYAILGEEVVEASTDSAEYAAVVQECSGRTP